MNNLLYSVTDQDAKHKKMLCISYRGGCIVLLSCCEFIVTGGHPPADVALRIEQSRVLEQVPVSPTFPVSLNMASGLKLCTWPGRNQIINEGLVHYFLDGAHTSESMRLCTNWFIQNSRAISKK
jgi:folylpolyglutamate synthase/dihydropteroate synthase